MERIEQQQAVDKGVQKNSSPSGNSGGETQATSCWKTKGWEGKNGCPSQEETTTDHERFQLGTSKKPSFK